MARALQCPSCGTKTRLDGVDSDTFQCEQCGQVLKVPPAARPASPAAPARPAATPGNGPAPPRRRTPAAEPPAASPDPALRDVPPPTVPAPSPPVVVAAGGTSVLAPRDRDAVPRRGSGRGAGRTKPPRDSLPLGVRIAAWVLAVPVGLAIVGIPARILGYLTSQKLLDVFVKHTLARYVPLAVIVVLWALATTVLVEVFIEGGRWIMLRRRGQGPAALEPDDQPPPGAPAPGAPAPPPRSRGSTVRARGS